MEKKTGYPDKPIASRNEDLFNIDIYVNGLCSFISSCDTPMTISIQGDWGSGKTSMMNMMKENLQGSAWPVWFNTWQFSQFDMGNALAFSMMDVLLKGLGCDDDFRKKVLGGLLRFGKKVIKVATDTAVGGEAAAAVDEFLSGGDNSDYASQIMELKDKFQQAVDDKLKKEHRERVVVFVDDLDRLQPSKAVELLEILKLFIDCEKCVFVLAVDYEVVTLGIHQKFGDNVSEEKGRSFFDKIIQLPFKMPVSNYDIKKYVKDMMSRLDMDTSDKEVTLFKDLIQTSIGFNPRSMKRLFNTYELLDIVTKSTVRDVDDSVRRRVLFAIICTQMCYEKLYLYFTSTVIEEDTFADLRNSETVMDVLAEIYGISAEKNEIKKKELEEQIKRASLFIPFFVKALQVDEYEELSTEELHNFSTILKCSVVTSVNATTEEPDTESTEWAYREENKAIVKETAARLKDIGEFSIWMPRKAHDDVRISDISGYYKWPTNLGFECKIEYYVRRTNDYQIDVSIFVDCGTKGSERNFFEILGENPLRLGIKPRIEDWGRYRYTNVILLNADDPTASERIAAVVKNGYKTLNEMSS